MRLCPRKDDGGYTPHQAWYYSNGRYYCQYCDGLLTNPDYLRKIIDYNTPVDTLNREEVIEKALNKALPVSVTTGG